MQNGCSLHIRNGIGNWDRSAFTRQVRIMKRNSKALIITLGIVVSIICSCAMSLFLTPPWFFNILALYEGAPPVLIRVFKFETPAGSSDQQIVRFMTEKYLRQSLVGQFDLYDWTGVYRLNMPFFEDDRIRLYNIDEIEIYKDVGNGKPVFVRFSVFPVVRDSWYMINYATIGGDGWTRIWWYLNFQDKGPYYELQGPYSGG
jgi:hypothetical protein